MAALKGKCSVVFLLLLFGIHRVGDCLAGAVNRIYEVQPGEVIWTKGLLANRWNTNSEVTLHALWRILDGTNYSHFVENFRIAAGLSTNRPRGAPFNDGEVYKWIEGASAILAVTKDRSLEKQLDEVIGLISQAQLPSGYIHSQIISRMRQGDTNAAPFADRNEFELYNFGHLFSAASLHFKVTGKTNFLNVAVRAAEYLEAMLQTNVSDSLRGSVCPSHFMGLVDLYRVTGCTKYLLVASNLFWQKFLVKGGGDDNQDRIPWLDQTEPVGHAVRANYLYAGAADLYLETGDNRYVVPLMPIWSNLVTRKLYITGGCGALYDGASPDGAKDQKTISRVHQAYGRNYQLPNITAHNETCASIGLVLWAWRMFLITGQSEYIDVLERAFYNTIFSGVDLSGSNFFYVNPLRSTRVLPTELRWPHRRQPYLRSFCCPPNVFRLIARSPSFAYGIRDDRLFVTLYGANRLQTKLKGSELVIDQETEFPWNGYVRFIIRETPAFPWSLMLRVPGWVEFGKWQVPVRVNYSPLNVTVAPGQFVEIRRQWQQGDVVELYLPMEPKLVEGHPLVEEIFGQIGVVRGPLVYCLEGVDLPTGRHITDVMIRPNGELRAWFNRRFLNGVVVIDVPVVFRDSQFENLELYRPLTLKFSESRVMPFIPYFLWGNRGQSEMSVWFPAYYGDTIRQK